ncbi:hypothetical protein [Aeromicrobium sp. 9AM]|nr:hypothetical protein [Aeromicrobium sp. 9AM]VXC07809.1 hypothetical protein AERO9AM_30621 [Aeromicrobium sp. 9AM]
MRVRLAITLTFGDEPAPDDDLTVDLVGTHHIPQASYDVGFRPDDDGRSK